MKARALLLVWAVAIAATTVSAQVSGETQAWGATAVKFLMTNQEVTEWAALRSDAEAGRFIDLFWARRDPTPDTPANELRQQFESRIAAADKRYAIRSTPGSQTDRGLAYVLFGEPTQIVNDVVRPSGAGTMAQLQRPVHAEKWIYRNEAAERMVGTKTLEIALTFTDDKYAGELELEEPSGRVMRSAALTVAKAALRRPFLTAADLESNADAAANRTVALRLIVVADSAIAHEVLRRAQEGENFAELARRYSSHPSARHGGYVGRIPFAKLTGEFKAAFAGKEPGASLLIERGPSEFAIIRLLTDGEAAAADSEMLRPE